MDTKTSTVLLIRRPVATTLMMLAIIIFGAAAYRALPVSDLPNVDFPTILVAASLPGANPDTMASTVATPLERQFSTYGERRALTVQATGQLTEAAVYRPVIVTYRNGAPVRLDQLGQVIDSVED